MSAASRYLIPRPIARRVKPGKRRGTVRLLVNAAHVAALALLLGVIVHIVIVLLVPRFAPADAWSKLSAVTQPWTFGEIARVGEARRDDAVIPGLDPNFGVAACRFDLTDGPASIVAEGDVPFWSLAIFDRRGQAVYSLNDRTAIGGRLDLVVVNPQQNARLRENPVEGLDRSILVRTGMGEGFVVVRALAPDPSWRPAVTSFLRAATCERLNLPAPG